MVVANGRIILINKLITFLHRRINCHAQNVKFLATGYCTATVLNSTCVYTCHVHTCALTSRLRLLHIIGYSTEVVTYPSDIRFHFPFPVFNMYYTNLSIMTFARRFYSGALNQAFTKHSGLPRSDVALLLKRCETSRKDAPHSYSMVQDSRTPLPSLSEFDRPEFSVYAADKSPRLANRQVGRRSNLTLRVVTVSGTHLAHTRSHGPPSEHFMLRPLGTD